MQAAGADGADLPWVWAELHRDQGAGLDATAVWRRRLAAATSRQSAFAHDRVPPAMPAAFVLQWLLDVAATPAVYAAWHGSWLVDPLGAGLSFALHPISWHPVAVQVRTVTMTRALLDERVRCARAAYDRAARPLAQAYRPGVNLGRHQRLAMVDDVWEMALARVQGLPPPERGSCCFLYVLPGTRECTGCPRRRGR